MRESSRLQTRIENLAAFYAERRRLPTYSEMMELFGFRSKNAVARLIRKLLARKILSKDAAGKLVPHGLKPGVRVLGSVRAGFPSPAEEELVDILSLDDYLIKRPGATYMLKVDGDSMIDAGIHPGDIVIVERGKPVRSGNIAVVQTDGEWTLKYYFKKGAEVTLRPANPSYPVLKPKNELVIGGVVIGCVRKYDNR